MEPSERERLQQRLGIIEAICDAQERMTDVMAAIARSEDAVAAVGAVMDLLHLRDEMQAMAVIDLPARFWTRQERARLMGERSDLRAAVERI